MSFKRYQCLRRNAISIRLVAHLQHKVLRVYYLCQFGFSRLLVAFSFLFLFLSIGQVEFIAIN
jgi:hypothetical protein